MSFPANASESTLPARDGTSLFHRQWSPAGDVRAQLLVVHGLKDHSGRYDTFARALGARGWRVDAFDLRGHGRSAGSRQRIRRFSEYVNDLDDEFLDVRRASKGPPVFLLGHSLGGTIVARYVLERSPPIAGFVLSAPALKVPENVSGSAVAFTRFLSAVAPGAHVLKLPSARFSRDPAVVHAMESDPLIDRRPVPARTAAEILASIELLQGSMERFRLPFLLAHGSADAVTNPEGSAELARRSTSADKTLKTYEGAFHDLLHEPNAVEVAQDLGDWLDHRA